MVPVDEKFGARPVVAEVPREGQRRVLVHPSGYRQSPYADVGTPGDDVKKGMPPRKLWHSSPGSSGG